MSGMKELKCTSFTKLSVVYNVEVNVLFIPRILTTKVGCIDAHISQVAPVPKMNSYTLLFVEDNEYHIDFTVIYYYLCHHCSGSFRFGSSPFHVLHHLIPPLLTPSLSLRFHKSTLKYNTNGDFDWWTRDGESEFRAIWNNRCRQRILLKKVNLKQHLRWEISCMEE